MSRIYMLMEDYDNAIQTTSELTEFLAPYFQKMPETAHFAYAPLEILLYFHKWKEILEYKVFSNHPLVLAYKHFSRAVAFASLGYLDAAQEEKNLMLEYKQKIPDSVEVAQNPFRKILDLAELMIEAKFAHVQNQIPRHIEYLNKAIALQDRLCYDEPPAWYVPIREMLGSALLEQHMYVEAEAVFRTALQKLQRNGRLLFGLALSLNGQGRTIDTYWVERELTSALQNATRPLNVEDLSW